MTDQNVVWRGNPTDLSNMTSLIDFLEWAREILKMNDDAEMVTQYHPDTGKMELLVTKLSGKGGTVRKKVLRSYHY